MYYVDKEGVKIKETGQIIEMGTEEWTKYKAWCAEGNEPEFGPPYVDETIVSYPLLEMAIKNIKTTHSRLSDTNTTEK